jgi:SAM-dependent methyltransferase
MDWKKESEMFNKTADYYDKYRPSYPKEIIDTFIDEANLSKGSRLLEIGAGSGKATELFVNKGFEILCIEPGIKLVDIGNARFIGEKFRFEQARFEEYDTVPKSFDAIFSAQAFHWVPQPIGYEKCARALKDGGYLALFWNMYITYDNDLDNELLSISNRYGDFADFLSSDGCEERIANIAKGIEDSGLFSKPKIIRSLWKQNYTADEYYGFALTGNRFIQKSDNEKQAAYDELINLAERHNGIIERPYLCVLYLAQKL